MKKPLLICLFVIAAAPLQPIHAAPPRAAVPAITQITYTEYTGPDDVTGKPDPIYRIVLRRDGTTIYVGSKTYMKRIGRYQGIVSGEHFSRLANLFQKNAYQNWRGSYNAYPGSDVASEKFEIVSGGRKKSIMVFGESGPRATRQASRIAYGLLWKIHWRKVSSADSIED